LFIEVPIDNFMEIQGTCYYVSSFGFTNTRIFCDLITEDKSEFTSTPKTYKESILQFMKNIDSSIEFYNLYVNGYHCGIRNIIFRHFEQSQIKANKMLQSIKIKELLKKNALTLIRIDFEPVPDQYNLKNIEDIRIVKQGKKSNIFIDQNVQLPIGLLEKPLKIRYKDNHDTVERVLYVTELYIKDGKLFVKAEVEKDIFDFQVFCENELMESGIEKMRGIIPAQKIESDHCKEGYQLLQQCAGRWKTNNNNTANLCFLAVRSFKKDLMEHILYKR